MHIQFSPKNCGLVRVSQEANKISFVNTQPNISTSTLRISSQFWEEIYSHGSHYFRTNFAITFTSNLPTYENLSFFSFHCCQNFNRFFFLQTEHNLRKRKHAKEVVRRVAKEKKRLNTMKNCMKLLLLLGSKLRLDVDVPCDAKILLVTFVIYMYNSCRTQACC